MADWVFISFSPLSHFSCSSLPCVSAFCGESFCGSRPTDMRSLVPAETYLSRTKTWPPRCSRSLTASRSMKSQRASRSLSFKKVSTRCCGHRFETSERKTHGRTFHRPHPAAFCRRRRHARVELSGRCIVPKKSSDHLSKISTAANRHSKDRQNGGKYFIWTARQSQEAYALVIDSLIYFGNDETAIEKSLA